MPTRQRAHGLPRCQQAMLITISSWLLPCILHIDVPQAAGTGACLIQKRWRREAEATPPDAVLVSLGSNVTSKSNSTASETVGRKTNSSEVPAGWFGGFDHDESTFDHDGVGQSEYFPERESADVSEDGNTVNMAAKEDVFYDRHGGLPSEWFEESVSGGAAAAWRTQFPSVEAFRGEGMKAVPWLPARTGRRKLEWFPSKATSIARTFGMTKKKEAEWFDDEVLNYDDFGRNRAPSEDSDRFYWDWEKKSWSVPLTCKDPGCVANATLKTFDAKKLQHARCRLSVGVHMTDFDDEYSREFVEWIIVNGARVNSRCDPMGRGCNASVADKDRGLHPCVTDFPLDNLLQSGKTELKIAGKISEMVDECPVNNNLLSGEARVTCFVRPHLKPTKPPDTPKPVIPGKDPCSNSTLLQCSEAGCIANATAKVCRRPETGEKCLLSVKIWQTDFDGDHGSKELVEWVKVNGEEVAKDFKPGRNPCKEVYDGKPASEASLAAQRAGVPTNASGISLDAQSAALLAPLPDDLQTPAMNCRRRVLHKLAEANSAFLGDVHQQPEQQYADSSMEPNSNSIERPHISHLRADPDDMKEIVKGQDVTAEVLAKGEVNVDAKISRMVDECAKDGYLLNAEVIVACK